MHLSSRSSGSRIERSLNLKLLDKLQKNELPFTLCYSVTNELDWKHTFRILKLMAEGMTILLETIFKHFHWYENINVYKIHKRVPIIHRLIL